MNVPAEIGTLREPDPFAYSAFAFDGARRWLLLLVGMIVSGVVVLLVEDAWAGVVGPATLVLAGILTVRANLLHPYTWFLPLYFLYSASVPLLVWLGMRTAGPALRDAVVLQWLGMAAFMVAAGPGTPPVAAPRAGLDELRIPAWVAFVGVAAVSGVFLGYVWVSGLSSKYSIALDRSMFVRLDHAFPVLIFLFGLLLAGSLLRGRIPLALSGAVVAWQVLALVVCGERDFLLRTLWLGIFLIHALYRRAHWGLLLCILLASLLLVNLMGSLKNALVREDVTVSMEQEEIELFPDEFVTACDNVELFLYHSANNSPEWGATLWWDVRRALLPGFLQLSPSPESLFNEQFWPEIVDQGGGRGFALVAEGYMNFGLAGAAIWLALLGLLTRVLYAKGASHPFWLVVYVCSMPLIVYVTRADFSSLLAQLAKHVLLPAFVVWALRKQLPVALERSSP